MDQLENIDSASINNIQWNYLGAVGAQPLETISGSNLDNVFSSVGLLVRTGRNTYSIAVNNSSN